MVYKKAGTKPAFCAAYIDYLRKNINKEMVSIIVFQHQM